VSSALNASSKRRVLLIGREHAASEATEQYLEYCGHEVALTKDPGSALQEADKLQPEVLICDLNVSSGKARIRAAMRIQEQHESAIVIITNHHCHEIQKKFPKLKVAQCLRKPISLRLLARSVSESRKAGAH